MKKKLLFFDIDGTLLAGGIPGYIPDSTIAALKQAQANGHYLFINTGRTYSFMPALIREFPFDGYICGCGTEVIFQGKTLYHHQIPRDVQFSLRDVFRQLHIQGIYESHFTCYFDQHDQLLPPVSHIMESYTKVDSPKPMGIMNEDEMNFDKFVVFTDCHSDIEGFFPIAEKHFQCTQWDKTVPYGYAEFVPKSCSKGTGIDLMIEHLGCFLEDCYVFGDGTNDLPMLTHVKNSVAMGNGSPEILDKTAYVTTPVDRDGIWNALKHFRLI